MFAIHRGWILATAGLMALFGALYVWRFRLPFLASDVVATYLSGLLGLLVFLFLANYASRKYLFLWFGGKLRLWLLAHIYLALLAGFLILLHARFSFEGPWSALTSGLLGAVLLTGFIGLGIYTAIPRVLVDFESILVPDEILTTIDGIQNQLETLVDGRAEPFARLALREGEVRRELELSTWRLLLMRSQRSRYAGARLAELEALMEVVPDRDRELVDQLAQLILKKRKLEAQLLEQRRWTAIRRGWLVSHAVLSAGFLTATAVHILSVLYY
jgi:hypothetical protein